MQFQREKNEEKSHPVFPIPPGKWIGAILPCIPDYHGPLQIATELGSGNRHLLLLLSPDASPWQHTDLPLEVFFNFCSIMRVAVSKLDKPRLLMSQNDPKCSDVVQHGHPNHFDSRKTTNQRLRVQCKKKKSFKGSTSIPRFDLWIYLMGMWVRHPKKI